MKNVLITGVSAGIGFELAKLLLSKGYTIYGISRRTPKLLIEDKNFHFISIDLHELECIDEKLLKFIVAEHHVTNFEYVFLNAGQTSLRFEFMKHVPYQEIDYIMRVNVWSNKIILDFLLNNYISIENVVISASSASQKPRAGYNSYPLSKVTLNMLAKLYALEEPGIYFAVIGLCIVNTFLMEEAHRRLPSGKFTELDKIFEKIKLPGNLVSPAQRALDIFSLLTGNLKEKVASGDFVDIRKLL